LKGAVHGRAGVGDHLEIYSRIVRADARQRYEDIIGDFPV
jgi:hypothetical protein